MPGDILVIRLSVSAFFTPFDLTIEFAPLNMVRLPFSCGCLPAYGIFLLLLPCV